MNDAAAPIDATNPPRPGFRFAQESFRAIEKEIRPLAQRHIEQVALAEFPAPLKINWAYYGRQDAAGRLWTLTMRETPEKRLVGYSLYWVNQSLVFNIRQAYSEALYVDADVAAKHPWAPYEFVRHACAMLQERGVSLVQHVEWIHAPYGSLLKRAGFAPRQQVHWKFLDGTQE